MADWPAIRLRDNGTLWWMGWPGDFNLAGRPGAVCRGRDAAGAVAQAAAIALLSEGAAMESATPGVVTYPHRAARRTRVVTALDHIIHFHDELAGTDSWRTP